jgi:hypothetical protein
MFSADWAAVGIVATIVTTVASLTWWLSGQFSGVRALVHERVDLVEKAILDKLEYHEKHDDMRFSGISNDLWDIRVRNAAKDGLLPIVKK